MQQSFLSTPWQMSNISFNISSDGFSFLPLTQPGKLDADHYSAEDSHGATESLFGSGNLSYASLQSSQTDAALQAQHAIDQLGDTGRAAVSDAGHGASYVPGAAAALENMQFSASRTGATGGGASDTDRAIGSVAEDKGLVHSAGENALAQSSTALGAAHYIAGGGDGGDGGNGNNGVNGSSGTNGENTGSSFPVSPPQAIGGSIPASVLPINTQGPAGADGHNGGTGGNGANGTDGTHREGNGDTVIHQGGDHTLINVQVNAGDLGTTIYQTVTTLGDTIHQVTGIIGDTSHLLENILHCTNTGLLGGEQVSQLVSTLITNLTQLTSPLLNEVNHLGGTVTGLVDSVSSSLGGVKLPDIRLCDLLDGTAPHGDTIGHLISSVAALPQTTLLLPLLQDTGASLSNSVSQLQGIVPQVAALLPNAAGGLHDLTGLLGNVVHQVGGTLGTLGVPPTAVGSLLDTVNGTVSHVAGALEPAALGLVDSLHHATGTILGGESGLPVPGSGNGGDPVSPGAITGGVTDSVSHVAGAIEPAVSGLVDTLHHEVGTILGGEGGLPGLGSGNGCDPVSLGPITEGVTDSVPHVAGAIEATVSGLVDTLHHEVVTILGGEGGLPGSGSGHGCDPVSLGTLTEGVTDSVSHAGGAIEATASGLVDSLHHDAATLLSGGEHGCDPVPAGSLAEGAVDTVSHVAGGLESTVSGLADTLHHDAGNLLTDGGGLWGSGGQPGDSDLGLHLSGAGHEIATGGTTDFLTSPVENIAGDIDIGAHGGISPLDHSATGNATGDSDLSLTMGIQAVDHGVLSGTAEVSLDPVEQVTGDIDLPVAISVNALGHQAAPIVNDGAGGTGGHDLLTQIGDIAHNTAGSVLGTVGTGSADHHSGGSQGGDSDLTIDLHTVAPGIETPVHAEVSLDPVEHVTGDIDIHIDGAISLLHGSTGSGTSGIVSGTAGSDAAIGGWTSAIHTDGGGMYGDIASHMGGAADVLPDPVGTVDHGLHILHNEPLLSGGSMAGSSHAHGLFG